MEKGNASGRTLIHGDYRIENFLVGPPGTDDELVVLDWQVVSVGNGRRDLAYFIGQNIEEASRGEQE
jgi:aminoglycoside phosphotransferase (APT) family kinase protein